jgi:hypothetical protein
LGKTQRFYHRTATYGLGMAGQMNAGAERKEQPPE